MNLDLRLDELDEQNCVAMWVRKTVVYFYPPLPEVVQTGCKVVTRSGETVKHCRCLLDDRNNVYYTGVVNGDELKWDLAGRFVNPYTDSPFDLFVAERYFDPQWKQKIKLSNAEWASQYQKKHPSVKVPEKEHKFAENRTEIDKINEELEF